MEKRPGFLPAGFLKSARARLFMLVILIVLPALSVQIFGAWSDLQGDLAAQRDLSLLAVKQAQGEFQALVTDVATVFADLLSDPQMRNPDNCLQIFPSLRFAYERLAPDASNLGLADMEGNIYCAINPVQGEKNLAAQPNFKAALDTLQLSIAGYQAHPAPQPPTFSAIYPVLSFDGEVQTVIFVTISTHWLETWQSKAALPAGVALTLFAQDGQVLWRRVAGQNIPPASMPPLREEWLAALSTDTAVAESPDIDGVVRVNALARLQYDDQQAAYLHLGYAVEALYAQAYRNLYWKLGLLVLVWMIAMVLAWWGSETMFLRPLQRLLEVVRRVQAGDLAVRVANLSGLGELASLAQSFDQMTDALQQRETARRQMEERFRAAFESSAIGMGLLSLEGDIIAVNSAVCQMSGYTEEELLHRNDSQNVYPPDSQVGIEQFQEMLAGKRGYYSVEKRYLRKNGEVFWARLTLSLICDDQGKPAYLVGMIEDIDQFKRTQQTLIESETRFRTMFDTAAVGIGILSLDRKLIEANPALCRIFDRSCEELLGQTSALVAHPDDLPRAIQFHQEMLDGKYDHYFDQRRYVRKNGEVFWADISMSIVRDENGKPSYIVGMVNDINQQKKAQETLRESEARFRAMFDNIAIGMAIVSMDRKVIGVNQTVSRLTGYSAEEMLGSDPSSFTLPEDREIGSEKLRDLVEGRVDSIQMERRYRHKDGHIFWGRVAYSAVPGEDGRPLYLVGSIEDITEEKEANRIQAESEERFRTLYETAEMGIVLIDLGNDGNLPLDEQRFKRLVAEQRLNPAMLRMFGYSAEEMRTTAIANLIYSEDRGIDSQQFYQLITGEIDRFRIEKRFVRKDGSIFWGRLTDSLARTADGAPRMVIGIIEDINEERLAKDRLAAQEAEYRRNLEQRITERTEELNLANELLREKAAQDAVTAERTRLARDLHDAVTQTLFSTTLIADVLPDIWEMNPAEGKRRLEEVRQLTRGALAEMRTLLVELRPNALVEVPLPTLLRQLTEALAGRSHTSIQLSAEGDRRLPAEVQVGLYRIAQEALNNVVKHAHASQAVVTLRMGETVRLTIADNGAGFDASTVTAEHLGLKIMRERAEAIHAKLTMYSEPGEGTQISVTW